MSKDQDIPIVFVGGPFSSALKPKEEKKDSYYFDNGLRKYFETVFEAIKVLGYNILSSHIAEQFGENIPNPVASIVERDKKWLEKSSLFIALIPLGNNGNPYRTDGTFVELGFAIAKGINVLLVIQNRKNPSLSFYIKYLDSFKNCTILDWDNFFLSPEIKIKEAMISNNQKEPTTQKQTRENVTHVEQMLASLSSCKEKVDVIVEDISITVFPDVFSPRLSHSSDFIMENWEIEKGQDVLDIGCGCGILGLFAVKKGAKSLTAVDINPQAVKNTRYNLMKYGYEKKSFLFVGDSLTALGNQKKYDRIILNAPYWNRKARNNIEMSCYDKDYKFLTNVLNESKNLLKPNGKLFLCFSDQGDTDIVNLLIQKNKYYILNQVFKRPKTGDDHIRIFWSLTV